MNGNRNRYSSTPMSGIKNKKRGQQADFSGGQYDQGNGEQGNRFAWLVVVILVVLPVLFVLSFILPESIRNIFKFLFLGAGLLTLAIMCFGKAFTKNARYSMSLIIAALLVISGVSLAVSLRANAPRVPVNTNTAANYFTGSNALESVTAQNSVETADNNATP
ncbi:MAG: hypothetical protein IJ174_02635, partial [Clostridia bacterium]|nr:hypothetical protein [Clostridia bacterium]